MSKVLKSLVVFASLAMIALPAQAYEQGTWLVRFGGGMVMPEDPAATVDEGVELVVDEASSLVFSGTYFFSPNWAVDILAALPFEHDIKVEGFGESEKIGSVKHLPPTVTLQYHFIPEGKFQPYVGVGLNYTTFFDESIHPDVADDLNLDDSFGVAAQIGADIPINEKWVFQIEARYMSIEPDVTLSAEGESETIGIDINPMVFSLGFGRVFN